MTLIVPAKNKNINQSPDVAVDVSLGVQMFFQKMIIELVMTNNQNGIMVEYTSTLWTMGVRISQTLRQLAIKPEGERAWKWSDLYTVPGIQIPVDSIIKIQNIKYRVMSSRANQEYGVIAFELLEDYV